jgi:hypothetical protein
VSRASTRGSAKRFEPLRRAVRDDDAAGRRRGREQVLCDRAAGASGAEYQRVAAGGEVARRRERLERAAGGDRVLRPAQQAAAAARYARHLAEPSGVLVELVEQVAGGPPQTGLVRRHERAGDVRFGFQPHDRLAVALRGGAERQVPALELDVAEPERLAPAREDRDDRRRAGRDAHEHEAAAHSTAPPRCSRRRSAA